MVDINKGISQVLLLGVFGTIVASIIDITLIGGGLFVNSTLDLFSNNKNSLSIIVSIMLLTAYLMQYLIQNRQADLSEQQENLMRSGFTPILGVTEREWGSEKTEDNDIQHQDANKVFADLVNNGNSAARDLRLWTGVKYDTNPSADIYYTSHSTPFQRTEEGTWWPTDRGGALSDSDDESVEFVASPKLKKMSSNYLKSDKLSAIDDIGDVIEEIGNYNDEITIVFSIKYQTATGDEQEITVGAYREKIRQLQSQEWELEGIHELSPEDYEDVKREVL